MKLLEETRIFHKSVNRIVRIHVRTPVHVYMAAFASLDYSVVSETLLNDADAFPFGALAPSLSQTTHYSTLITFLTSH